MSWDVFLFRVPEGITSYNQLPDNFKSEAMGYPDNIISTLEALYPTLHFDDKEHGELELGGAAIDLDLQFTDEGRVNVIAMSVYGGGDPISIIQKICKALGCKAIEPVTCDFIQFNGDGEASFQQWQDYRDFVVNRHNQPPPNSGAKGKQNDTKKM